MFINLNKVTNALIMLILDEDGNGELTILASYINIPQFWASY
ncbi:hypothetical protein SBF1_6950002 [Candidatus Desulfosporosinus infrequens]|uniref:Uncharacterized protein n=1 Tax=Candidatus Desulfosporosinus infrequens TaxID=2043169 RepID=A0A2U3LP64_9FIRM|nr:hypothetical protein SBF1_6950002 [Candidatus Desulfosporosinus infrequens]